MATAKRIYRGKSSEARLAERREKFIAAGCNEFGRHGFHAVTVKQLCQSASLTERYFYQSFGKREALFAACYDQKLDELLRQITAALLAAKNRSASDLAQTGLSAFFNAVQADQELARILLIEIYGVPYDQERLFRRSIGRFSELVQHVALSQNIPAKATNFDADLLSAGLVGVCIQMAQRWIIDGYQHPASVLVDNCMLIFNGLGDRLGM